MNNETPPVTGQDLPVISSTPEPETGAYKDDDFVYVHPDERKVVGRVEWNKNGIAKPLAMPDATTDEDEETPAKGKARGGPRRRKRYFPWGTYKSMKAIYKLEGKAKRDEPNRTLDDVIAKAVVEPFWE